MAITKQTPLAHMNEIVSKLRELQNRRQVVKTDYEKKLAQLNAAYEKRLEPIANEEAQLMKRVSQLVIEHGDKLFGGKSKTLEVTDGSVSLRLGNPAVELARGCTEDDAVEEVRRRGLLRKLTIQPKRKLNKTVITRTSREVLARFTTFAVVQKERVRVTLPDNAGKLEHELPSGTNALRRDLP